MTSLPNNERSVKILFSDGTETVGWYITPHKGKEGKWSYSSINKHKTVIGWEELKRRTT